MFIACALPLYMCMYHVKKVCALANARGRHAFPRRARRSQVAHCKLGIGKHTQHAHRINFMCAWVCDGLKRAGEWMGGGCVHDGVCRWVARSLVKPGART